MTEATGSLTRAAVSGQQILRVGTQEDFHCIVIPDECVPPAVNLSPAQLVSTYRPGQHPYFTVTATMTDVSAAGGTVHVYLVDAAKIVAGPLAIVPINERQVSVGLPISNALPLGRHQGTLLVQICRDSACADEFAGSPVRLPYDLHAVHDMLQVWSPQGEARQVVHQGATLPGFAIDVTAQGLQWTAYTAAPWLNVDGVSGSGTSRLAVSYRTQGLTPGFYDTSVDVTSNDGQRASVPVRIEVKPPASFTPYPSHLEISGINGSALESRWLRFHNDSHAFVQWTARAGNGLIDVTPSSGLSYEATVKVTPSAEGLAAGEHSAEVVLSAPGVATQAVPVTLRLAKATLSAALPGQAASSTQPTLTFGAASGPDSTTLSLDLELDTGSRTWPWTLGQLPAWLTASAQEGTVGERRVRVQFTPRADLMPSGEGVVTVLITARVSGDIVILPVRMAFNTSMRRLLPSKASVGLVSTPEGSLLSASIRIDDSRRQSIPWAATSGASWLKVTAAGQSGMEGGLVLTADPRTLPSAVLSRTTVTVSSSAPGVIPLEIPVVLWKATSAGQAQRRLPKGLLDSALVADSFRPYFYMGGKTIDVWHAHSGVKVATLPVPDGSQVSSMLASADGATLYALDPTKERVLLYNLETMQAAGSWPMGAAYGNSFGAPPPVLINPGGQELLLTGSGFAFSSTGVPLGYTQLLGVLAPSPDGRKVHVATNYGLREIARWAIDHSGKESDPPLLRKELARTWPLPTAPGAMISSPDGSRLFTNHCEQLDSATLSPALELDVAGAVYAVGTTFDGRLLCGGDPRDWNSAGLPDLRIFRIADGAKLKDFRIGAVDRESRIILRLAVSADGQIAALVIDNALVLQRITP